MARSNLFLAISACALFGAATPAQANSPEYTPGPSSIVNGIDVGECGYASVGSYGHTEGDDRVACSLTLIAPDVVLTAAHCLEATGTPPEVRFGETYLDAPRSVATDFCMTHPGYDGDWGDIGFCVLAEAVLDIPITPLAAGCELEAILPGDTVDVVGFGVSSAVYNPDLPADFPFDTEGAGIKRTTTQTVEQVVDSLSQLWLLGDEGNSSCFGDSGGPAFARLDDGHVRVIGVGQQLHPANPDPDHPCGYGIVYQASWPHLEWLESMSGRDLSPCWNGTDWAPGPGCDDFAVEPELEVGTWAQGCLGGGLGDPSEAICEEPGGTTSTTGGEEDDTWGEEDDTWGEEDDTWGEEVDTGAEDDTWGEESSEGESSSDDGGDDELGGDLGDESETETGTPPGYWIPNGGSCSCSSQDNGAPAPLAGLGLLALLGLVRRRRSRAESC